MKLTLKIWRQKARLLPGKFETFQLDNVSEDMSFLEMLDIVNEGLIEGQKEPIAFDSTAVRASGEVVLLSSMAFPMRPESDDGPSTSYASLMTVTPSR